MGKQVFTKMSVCTRNVNIHFILSCILSVLILSGCASSDVSRDATSNIDLGVQNAKNLATNAENSSIAENYQNSSQTTKGVIIGGAAGAITGSLASGIGVVAGTATGLVLGGAYGAYIDANTTLQDQLENRGANMIVLGDQILIVIPSSRLFNDMTATIKPSSYSTLYLVQQYISQYTKTLVKIAAYTNDTGSASVDLALSQEQANSLVRFLTASGTDARLLYGVGYGGTNLVSRNTLDWNGSDNYRIEISLERLNA